MEKVVLFLLFSLVNGLCVAQNAAKVELVEDSRIHDLVKKHEQINRNKETINGFRVQIHFGSERDKAMEQKVKFLQLYSEVPTYEIYEAPNFKIRVGDFRTRLEAQKFAKELNANFPSAFIVSDDIRLPKLD